MFDFIYCIHNLWQVVACKHSGAYEHEYRMHMRAVVCDESTAVCVSIEAGLVYSGSNLMCAARGCDACEINLETLQTTRTQITRTSVDYCSTVVA